MCKCGNADLSEQCARNAVCRNDKRACPNRGHGHWPTTIIALVLELALAYLVLSFFFPALRAQLPLPEVSLPDWFTRILVFCPALSGNTGFFSILVSLIIAGPLAVFVYRREKRKEYQYKRSEFITGARAEKEIECINNLAVSLYNLVRVTTTSMDSGEPVSSNRTISKLERNKALKRAMVELSNSCLYLNYTDENGCAYCGVEKNKPMGASDSCRNKTLYERGLEIYILSSKYPNSEWDPEAQLLGPHRCEVALDCAKKSPAEFLECRLIHFVNCANCRLKAIETGTRDTRRINFVNALPIHRLKNYVLKHFDSECMYKGTDYVFPTVLLDIKDRGLDSNKE